MIITRARWWQSVPVALLFLFLIDLALRLWHPHPDRLPEQFSPAYLHIVVSEHRNEHPLIVFLGDSVLWGYGLPQQDAAPSLLLHAVPSYHLLNLSYEGGSSANTYFMLSYLLACGIHPKIVVFNVNSKESNAADSAYNRLQPSLERVVKPLLRPSDKARLELQEAVSICGENVYGGVIALR